MSHEEHHDTHQPSENSKSRVALKSSFWFVIILVGLFIAALNFISSESGEENNTEKTEMTAPGTNAQEPAAQASETGHSEVPAGKTADTAKH